VSTPTKTELEAATGARYDVGDIVASGGMAIIYRGRHKALGTTVAIKVLPREIALSTVRLARFRQEATLASRLSHPNIVPVFECDVQGEIAYLVMPYIEGETLAARLKAQGPMAVPDALAVLEQVGAALGFAHQRGVIHRDVKPSNILFEQAPGRWMLTDFGVAHAAQAEDGTITQTGAAVGTPVYMAPEQAGGAALVDQRADVFGLAAVAYEMLAGKPPDKGASAESLVKALRQRADVPGEMARGIVAGLAAARDERPSSVDAWLERVTGVSPRRGRLIATIVTLTVLLAAWLIVRGRGGPGAAAQPAVAVLPFQVSGPGAQGGAVSLDSVLPQALAWQLAMLPETRVLSNTVLEAAINRRFGREPQEPDTLIAVARGLGATSVVLGQAQRSGDRVTLSVAVRDARTKGLLASAEAQGPVDSLHALVAGLVIQAFAAPAARARAGWAASLPRGLPAIAAYFQADRDFRHGAYAQAITELDRVIALDSTYAPAHFKRMLAAMQLSPTSGQIHAALQAVRSYAKGLDPVSQRLLTGYADLLRDGDLKKAERTFREIVAQYPDAVDAWFALGEVLFHFAPLLGTPLGEAQRAFDEALQHDPTFAGPVAHLVALSLAAGDEAQAKAYMARYVTIDSVSVFAELMRAGDTLLFHRTAAPGVLRSFPKRDTPFLRQIAFLSSQFGRGPLERAFGASAIDELWQRAVTGEEKTQAFRLRMATLLGTGREAEALRTVSAARTAGVPAVELDRWAVLSAITPLPDLGDAAPAARRLAATADDPMVGRWLAARWFLARDSAAAGKAERELRSLARGDDPSPLVLSLLDDLQANRLLARGDTAGALKAWTKATARFSIEQVPFALVGSLWPIRLELALTAASAQPQTALDAAGTFRNLAGFVDQVAWPHALEAEAEAAVAVRDTTLARNTYRHLLSLLNNPDGGGVVLREEARLGLVRLGGKAVRR
jgi:tRNA A-37 threonylcarbamoyl transferase component Bud32/Tfp pilus assembly protein PilF/TolB-like protein